ncbi:MAG: adenosylcobinamide-GDP ribazoletransferase, partial [Selenomonadales bacterium]|nr:adenosylcobinamide-GDP ribazoletransferase [Selenomonadales bacterium]
LAVTAYTIILLIPVGMMGLVALTAAVLFTLYFSRYVTRLLGGLTGDVYGAVCVLSETMVLVAGLLGSSVILNRGCF